MFGKITSTIPFTIMTDCKAFEQTMAKKNATAKVARWALALEEYEMTVQHRPGTAMRHVDSLSRNAVLVIENAVFEQVRRSQLEDPACKRIIQLIEKGVDNKHVLRSGVIYHFDEGYYRLKVPKSMADSLLRQIHGDTHINGYRMEKMIRQDYQIDDLSKHIKKLINNCVTCILANKKRGKQEGWLHPIDKHDIPLHTYHIDHIGPMETTTKKYKHILVVTDGFTKFTWLYPCKTTACAEAIQKLTIQQAAFGNPRRIVADKGSAFTAGDFQQYCTDEEIHLHLVTTATPRGNGQVERKNATIKATLQKLAINEPAKWFKHVERLQRCMNATVSRSIGTTPFNLMFGTTMNNKEDIKLMEVLQKELIVNFLLIYR